MLLEVKTNLNPINFVIISGILQSIILSFVLLFYKKGNGLANRLLGLFLLVCSLHFLWPLIIDSNVEKQFYQIFWIPYSYVLAIGPLLWLYTKSLTQPNLKLKLSELVHLLPTLIEFITQGYFISLSIGSDKLIYDVEGFITLRIVELIGVGISILIYGTKCLKIIKSHEALVLENFSNQKDIALSWLLRLIKYLSVLWIFWIAFEISFLLFWKFQIHFVAVYLLLYILLGTIVYSTYWIGVQGLGRSELLTMEMATVKEFATSDKVYSRLNEIQITGYIEKINQLMLEEKLYLHETLSLRMLAKRVESDPNLVSYLLNNVLQKSFYDYVNEFRIEEVKRKISDPDYTHLKIVEVAFECGFNSKATFNRVFKQFAGKPPSEYKKEALSKNNYHK